jgi:hypothetical protein
MGTPRCRHVTTPLVIAAAELEKYKKFVLECSTTEMLQLRNESISEYFD